MRPNDTELAGLLRQFVPVRMTSFKGVDMNRFQFDYDLTFSALMMNAGGETYARYGTKDADSPTARLSLAGLKRAMQDVLALHRERKPRPAAHAGAQKPFTLADIPAYAQSRTAQEPCARCHYANNFRFKQMRREGRFTEDLLFQYPLPENIGVSLDVDRNNVVKAVLPDSPAAQAGVRAGDVIAQAEEVRVFSSADLQFALNAVPDPGRVTLHLRRGDRDLEPVTLALPRNWRRTDISWRPSMEEARPAIGIWLEPLTPEQKRQCGLPPERMALRVSFLYPEAGWEKTRGELKGDDVIVGINGKPLSVETARKFHAFFRLNFEVGDTVTLNVARGGKRLDIPVPCLDMPQEPGP